VFLIKKLSSKNLYIYFLFIAYLFSIIYVKETIFIFYNSTDSPDFIRYFKFLEFNVDVVKSTSSEQGFLFYDLHSLYFYLRNFDLTQEDFFVYLSKSIQELNSLLFMVGSVGLYKLLRLFKYSSIQILTTLIIVNFVPISIAQRIVFKPEILIFALFPWLIISYELFFKSKKLIYLICSIPILIVMILQKGSSFAMISIFLTLFYLKRTIFSLKLYRNSVFVLVIVMIVLPLYLTFEENSKLNNLGLFNLQSGAVSEAKYDNKGSWKLMYKTKPEELFFYPYKNEHSYSGINITLLDSFGDYFDIYWNNDSSYFSKDTLNIVTFKKSSMARVPLIDLNKNQITFFTQEDENNYYLRNLTSLFVAIFFYFNFFIYYKKADRFKKKFFLLPLLGYLILMVHVIFGIPQNNFDPLVGDTLKPFYYSFFLIITISFLISELSRTKLRSVLLLVLIIPTFLYIYGFPKNYSEESRSVLDQVNSYSTFCRISYKVYNFDNNSEIMCHEKPLKIRNYEVYKAYSSFNSVPNFHVMNFLNFIFIIFSLFVLSVVKIRI
tara:strand:+ start:3428 stop:5077 length:1650 start_codon:yes stop_codon:yes gene_type:complete